ncbi:transcriptional repressor TraM [Sinorhizobium meliloti]|uniref:transcriptional repressor TraM n=1 Tax=Rhizobium meliloti TaxID=382 RepID=UPI000FD47D05|nr:transcriptional repressor TraM [Sinorhizobium meliloti]RVN80002.1 transcriptional regulator [Sinorhizobium meliloti]
MDHERNDITADIDLRPIVGLLSNESEHVIEILTVGAIKKHRTLVDRAERLFQIAHGGGRGGDKEPSEAHVAYLEATIEMHAQMSALTTLLNILGRTPKV